jgi:hypothetical protein
MINLKQAKITSSDINDYYQIIDFKTCSINYIENYQYPAFDKHSPINPY